MHAVSLLSITPVKALGLWHPEEIALEPRGVVEDRRFYLVDDEGRVATGRRHGTLVQVRAAYDDASEVLTLDFPDGTRVQEAVAAGAGITTDFSGERRVSGQVVHGPWGPALSAYADASLRLVRTTRPGDGWDVHPVTLLGEPSVEELARRSGRTEPLDGRRFRMTVMVSGGAPHDEDRWIGRAVRIGSAVVRVTGPVPRCVVTTQDPRTGHTDFDTLKKIRSYRGVRDGEAIDFGVYGEVEQPGRVRVGDPVQPVG